MRRTQGGRIAGLAMLSVGLLIASPGVAPAAPAVSTSRLDDDGAMNSGKETHSHDAQHGEDHGHLPPVQHNVDLIGFTDLFAGQEQPGRIGDVSAKGNYAYLTHYYRPSATGAASRSSTSPTRRIPRRPATSPATSARSRARGPRSSP